MVITIDSEVIQWMGKNDLWALVENKMQFYIGEHFIESFIFEINEQQLKPAPRELNNRNLIFYTEYKNLHMWYVLLRKVDFFEYEVIRLISIREKDAKYFY